MSAPRADDRIRVALLIGTLEIGGAERQLVRLANGLDRSRFRPAVITCFGAGALAGDLRSDVEHRVLRLPALRDASAAERPVVSARIALALARELRSLRPDVLHAYLPTTYVLGALAARLARVPVTIAGRRGLHSYRRLPAGGRSLARLANRQIAVHICNSEAVRAHALADEPDLAPARVVVVHSGIDAAELAPVAVPPSWRRPTALLGAMVANFHEYKGHRLLLDALAQVAGMTPLRLVCLGSGSEELLIQTLIRERRLEDTVVLAGARPDADRLIGNFDFSLLASSQEGFPNALLEAMAAGVPVIGPRVGGVPELVRDGVDGLLFKPGSAADLARCILTLADDAALRERLGREARRHVQAEFSTAAMVSRTEAIYAQAVESRHAAA